MYEGGRIAAITYAPGKPDRQPAAMAGMDSEKAALKSLVLHFVGAGQTWYYSQCD
jgi:hypothetical protein